MYISVDVEANGPIPGKFSMIKVGAVVIESALNRTFYGEFEPLNENFDPEALRVIGVKYEDTFRYPPAKETTQAFMDWVKWLRNEGRVRFVSDNAGFDWQFVNYYFHYFFGENPFGFSSLSLTSFYKGVERDVFASFKYLRKTKHTHHPVDDAMGNAEAFLAIREKFNIHGM